MTQGQSVRLVRRVSFPYLFKAKHVFVRSWIHDCQGTCYKKCQIYTLHVLQIKVEPIFAGPNTLIAVVQTTTSLVVQGDISHCFKPPVDIDLKVSFNYHINVNGRFEIM